MDGPDILSVEYLNMKNYSKDNGTLKNESSVKLLPSFSLHNLSTFQEVIPTRPIVNNETLHYEKTHVSDTPVDIGGYATLSDKDESATIEHVGSSSETTVYENKKDRNYVMKEIIEKYHFNEVPPELKPFVLGASEGLPNDYSVPIESKPVWLDMEKFKKGQEFARKYFVGVNMSEMMALFVLFALPDGLETLIFSGNSSTPFTSFRRYLSTVLRVSSWYDHNIWVKGTPGYQNIKTVRAMHLNISKKINSTPYEELQDKVTLAGSSSKPPLWKTGLKEIVQEDFQSGCPFKAVKPIHGTIPGKTFVNQLDMSTTQFGFVGLMIAYPEKFGAASATKEELEAFLHTWRCIGYLLGMEDKYNFCAGNLEEVTQRCHSFVDNWAKPNFQTLTDDWEHMSRCLAEGMTYCASSPPMSFEASIMYLCWVLDIPAPRLYASLSWSDKFQFLMLKFMMKYAVRAPGVLPVLNWFVTRSLAKASKMTPEEMKRLEDKRYDYEEKNDVESKDKRKKKTVKTNYGRGIPFLALAYAVRLLI